LRWRLVARIERALRDPGLEVADRGGVELGAVARHLEFRILVLDRLEQPAFGGLARDDGGAVAAALEQACAGVEREAALLLGRRRVARITLLREDGADARLEELAVVC